MPTPEPTPSYTVEDAPLPFYAYILRDTVYYGDRKMEAYGGVLSAGTEVVITDRYLSSRYGYSVFVQGKGWVPLADVAYGYLPSSASVYRRSASSARPEIVDFYGTQMAELRRLLGR